MEKVRERVDRGGRVLQARIAESLREDEADDTLDGVVVVPSRTKANKTYFVELSRRRCSCPDSRINKNFCYHLKVARWSARLALSIAEIVRRVNAGCRHAIYCSFCMEQKDYHPDRESRLQMSDREVVRQINNQSF